MKLKESISPNSVKIIELYNKLDAGVLDTSPDFQRKLVWKKQHKYHFIETILYNFPFPEIYIASSEIDISTLKTKEIVVDGKQRLTAIVDYIKGENDFKDQKKIPSFKSLSDEEKTDFLNYYVTVKDLKNTDKTLIAEIFQRINNTDYSLNTVEKTNAQYGDGEFSVFCKQIIDSTYTPTEDSTDIILDSKIKRKLNSFFTENKIFSHNDRSRMYDNQYIMLIVSTLLEGDYFSRSQKISEYLKQYNSNFDIYEIPLNQIINSVDIISKIGFSERSYWFNQANLLTLIIELSDVNKSDLDFEKFELELLIMENKVTDYFNEENLDTITSDERKYFEVARQGSHEKSSRMHRGLVISQLIKKSLKSNEIFTKEGFMQQRLNLLNQNGVKYITIEPTQTGLNKSIMDATSSIRNFFKENGIHNYENQEYGTDHKVTLDALYILGNSTKDSKLSLYRSNGRGDARIWMSNLSEIAKANDIIAIILRNKSIYLINVSNLEIETLIQGDNSFSNLIIQ